MDTHVSPRSQTLLPRPRSPPAIEPTHWLEPLETVPRLMLVDPARSALGFPCFVKKKTDDTHSSALIDHDLPPQLNATSGGESHGYWYRPWSASYTFEPDTLAQNFLAALVGAVMMVLPESMIVSKLDAALLPSTVTEAPPICQKPLSDESVWYSMSPE